MAATVTVLGGCGAASQAYAPPGGIAIAPNGTPAGRGSPAMLTNATRSWMSPDAAKSKDLLYVSDYSYFKNEVEVFSYPADKLVGTLTTDMLNPDGLCVDNTNDGLLTSNV